MSDNGAPSVAPVTAPTRCRAAESAVIFSHRGNGLPGRPSLYFNEARMRTLHALGVTSFDLDIFWASDSGVSTSTISGRAVGHRLFVGHPNELRAMWVRSPAKDLNASRRHSA